MDFLARLRGKAEAPPPQLKPEIISYSPQDLRRFENNNFLFEIRVPENNAGEMAPVLEAYLREQMGMSKNWPLMNHATVKNRDRDRVSIEVDRSIEGAMRLLLDKIKVPERPIEPIDLLSVITGVPEQMAAKHQLQDPVKSFAITIDRTRVRNDRQYESLLGQLDSLLEHPDVSKALKEQATGRVNADPGKARLLVEVNRDFSSDELRAIGEAIQSLKSRDREEGR